MYDVEVLWSVLEKAFSVNRLAVEEFVRRARILEKTIVRPCSGTHLHFSSIRGNPLVVNPRVILNQLIFCVFRTRQRIRTLLVTWGNRNDVISKKTSSRKFGLIPLRRSWPKFMTLMRVPELSLARLVFSDSYNVSGSHTCNLSHVFVIFPSAVAPGNDTREAVATNFDVSIAPETSQRLQCKDDLQGKIGVADRYSL